MNRWEGFLKNVVANDEQITLLRSWMGKLLGDGQRPEKMLLLVGAGASGKTTLLNLLSALVGEGKSLNRLPNMKTPFEVAELKDKRLIVLDAEQSQKVGKISTRIKTLLGGDLLVGRKKYQEMETFIPDCAVACATNHVEQIGDLALDSRTLRIDMSPVAVRDPDLFDHLLAEGAEIKEWALSL